MIIPEAVKKETSWLMENVGGTIDYLGKIEDGRNAYCFTPSEEQEIGYPEVYLYDGHIVFTETGHAALEIINELDLE